MRSGDTTHWYTSDGVPKFGATLRDARKEGLFPSVNGIMAVEAKYTVEQYMYDQILSAARAADFSLPDDQWKATVLSAANRHSKKAAKLGSIIHRMIKDYCSGRRVFMGPSMEVQRIFALIRYWIDVNVREVVDNELIVVNHDAGYAGTVDAVLHMNADYEQPDFIPVMVDWKTRFVKPSDLGKSGEPHASFWYPQWCRQLAAYAHAYKWEGPVRLMSVVISTNPEIARVFTREWTMPEWETQWNMFLSLLSFWKLDRNHFPEKFLAKV